jgi:hypothetical protein
MERGKTQETLNPPIFIILILIKIKLQRKSQKCLIDKNQENRKIKFKGSKVGIKLPKSHLKKITKPMLRILKVAQMKLIELNQPINLGALRKDLSLLELINSKRT